MHSLDICHDHHDRQSCKIFPCVYFFQKATRFHAKFASKYESYSFFLLNLHTFPPIFLKFYIFFSISIKRDKNHFFEIYPVSKRSYNLRVFTHQWPRKFYIFFSISTKKRTIFIEIYSVLSLAKRVTIYVFFYSPMANEWSHQLYRHWENL